MHTRTSFLINALLNLSLFFTPWYVDDTFCICHNRQQDDKFLSYINSFHKNITFTAEVDADNKLRFPNTLVMFNNNSFSTDLYRKKLLQVFIMNMVSLLRMLAIGLFMIPTQLSIVLWLRFVSSGHVTSSCQPRLFILLLRC